MGSSRSQGSLDVVGSEEGSPRAGLLAPGDVLQDNTLLPPSQSVAGNFFHLLDRLIALPHSGYRRGTVDADKRRLASVAKEHGVRCAAVGLPRAPDGLDCAPLRAFVKRYAHAALRGSSIGAVAFVDESFSTLEAASNVSLKSKASLRRDPVRMKQAIDSNAAAIILQDALDIIGSRRLWDGC